MTLTLKSFSGQLTFDGATCRLTYPPGWKSGYLRRVLGERVIPVTALAGVDYRPASAFKNARLRLRLRDGADPLLTVIGNQLTADHPDVLDSLPDGALAARAAAEITAAIAATGLFHTPADRPIVAAPKPPPLTAKGTDGRVEFDGETLTFAFESPNHDGSRFERRLPITAIEGVQWKQPSWSDGYLHFRVLGAEPAADPAKHLNTLRLPSATNMDAVLLAAAVLAAAGRARETADAEVSRPTPRRIDGTPLVESRGTILEGIDGRGVLDADAVTIIARAAGRRIPLSAIDWVELVDSGERGAGWVRVHLLDAPPDEAPFDPARDQDTVRHADDGAALTFTHRVTMALEGVERAPDPELLRTRGDRPDIVAALRRASRPARGLVNELRALPHRLPDGDQVEELELANLSGQPGLLARTERRVLFLVGGEPVVAVSRRRAETSWGTTDERGLGDIEITAGPASYRLNGVWAPARFTDRHDRPASSDLVARVRDLAELRDAGLLSDEEFAARRTQLLDQI
jgi:hypothetical protein